MKNAPWSVPHVYNNTIGSLGRTVVLVMENVYIKYRTLAKGSSTYDKILINQFYFSNIQIKSVLLLESPLYILHQFYHSKGHEHQLQLCVNVFR